MLAWENQLFSLSGVSVMISQVFLSILLPSRRVFLSSELKLPQILKIPKCHVNSFRFTSLDVNDHC